MENKTIADLIGRIEEALGPVTFTNDDPVPSTGMEIQVQSDWFPADRQTWRSWTGSRRLWGVEYHGPVYVYMSPEGSMPFTGRRQCGCKTCQEHVLPHFRPN